MTRRACFVAALLASVSLSACAGPGEDLTGDPLSDASPEDRSAPNDLPVTPDAAPTPDASLDAPVDVAIDAALDTSVDARPDAVTPDVPAPDVPPLDVPRVDVAPLDVAIDTPPPPFAFLCHSCTSNAECGFDGFCLTNTGSGERICGAPCGTGCPSGYNCRSINITGLGTIQQCVPNNGSCVGAPPIDAGIDAVTDAATDTAPVDVPTGATLTPGTRAVSIGTRQAIVYVPASFRAGGAGLVALHGNGDTATNFLATSGLREVADAQGVALALPVALTGSGPMGVDWDAYTTPSTSNRDVALALGARDYLVAGGVSTRSTFLLGYSQGGYLAYHVAMAGSDRFGAVSVVSAGDPLPGAGLDRMASRHVPMSLLIGSGDFGLANAQRTRDSLRALGFEVRYTELPGVGHCCPLSGRAASEWSWLAMRPLP